MATKKKKRPARKRTTKVNGSHPGPLRLHTIKMCMRERLALLGMYENAEARKAAGWKEAAILSAEYQAVLGDLELDDANRKFFTGIGLDGDEVDRDKFKESPASIKLTKGDATLVYDMMSDFLEKGYIKRAGLPDVLGVAVQLEAIAHPEKSE